MQQHVEAHDGENVEKIGHGAAPMSSIRGQTGREFNSLIAAAMTSRSAQMRVCATSPSPTHYASKTDWMVSKSQINELSESVRNRGV